MGDGAQWLDLPWSAPVEIAHEMPAMAIALRGTLLQQRPCR